MIVLGATAMGLAQFSVYVGMSSPYRLASVVMPAVLVASYWADRIGGSGGIGRASARVTLVSVYAAAVLVLLTYETPLRNWLDHDSPTSLGQGALSRGSMGCASLPECLLRPPVAARKTRAAEALIHEYAQGANVALILDDYSTTEILMRSGRRNAVSINVPFQDSLAPTNAERVAKAPHRLAAGDLVLSRVRRGKGVETPGEVLAARLMKALCSEFECHELQRHRGIIATRLTARAPPPGRP